MMQLHVNKIGVELETPYSVLVHSGKSLTDLEATFNQWLSKGLSLLQLELPELSGTTEQIQHLSDIEIVLPELDWQAIEQNSQPYFNAVVKPIIMASLQSEFDSGVHDIMLTQGGYSRPSNGTLGGSQGPYSPLWRHFVKTYCAHPARDVVNTQRNNLQGVIASHFKLDKVMLEKLIQDADWPATRGRLINLFNDSRTTLANIMFPLLHVIERNMHGGNKNEVSYFTDILMKLSVHDVERFWMYLEQTYIQYVAQPLHHAQTVSVILKSYHCYVFCHVFTQSHLQRVLAGLGSKGSQLKLNTWFALHPQGTTVNHPALIGLERILDDIEVHYQSASENQAIQWINEVTEKKKPALGLNVYTDMSHYDQLPESSLISMAVDRAASVHFSARLYQLQSTYRLLNTLQVGAMLPAMFTIKWSQLQQELQRSHQLPIQFRMALEAFVLSARPEIDTHRYVIQRLELLHLYINREVAQLSFADKPQHLSKIRVLLSSFSDVPVALIIKLRELILSSNDVSDAVARQRKGHVLNEVALWLEHYQKRVQLSITRHSESYLPAFNIDQNNERAQVNRTESVATDLLMTGIEAIEADIGEADYFYCDIRVRLKYLEPLLTQSQWLGAQQYLVTHDYVGLLQFIKDPEHMAIATQSSTTNAVTRFRSRGLVATDKTNHEFEKEQTQHLAGVCAALAARLNDIQTNNGKRVERANNQGSSHQGYEEVSTGVPVLSTIVLDLIKSMAIHLEAISLQKGDFVPSQHQLYERLTELLTWLNSQYQLCVKHRNTLPILNEIIVSIEQLVEIKKRFDDINPSLSRALQRGIYWTLPLIEWGAEALIELGQTNAKKTMQGDCEPSADEHPVVHVQTASLEKNLLEVDTQRDDNSSVSVLSGERESALIHQVLSSIEPIFCIHNWQEAKRQLKQLRRMATRQLPTVNNTLFEGKADYGVFELQMLHDAGSEETRYQMPNSEGLIQSLKNAVSVIENNLMTQNNKHRQQLCEHGLEQLLVQGEQTITAMRCQLMDNEALVSADAGIVLLWPFLTPLFAKLGLLDMKSEPTQGQFVDERARAKAHSILCFIVGVDPMVHATYTINALLGLPPTCVVETPEEVLESEHSAVEHMLAVVISRWHALQDMSVATFSALFLQREGQVQLTERGLAISIQNKPQDVLMMRMPWGLGLIQLPWLPELLIDVKWHSGF